MTKIEKLLEIELKAEGRKFTPVHAGWSESHQLEVAERMKSERLRGLIHRLAQESRDRTDPEFNYSPVDGYNGFTVNYHTAGGGVRVIRSIRGLGG